ncbi:MAG: hypothetical protein ACTHMK_11920 [Dyella sp.]|uniref:hypothetical protein n=1 Tax=Dyella sp. TaxID=1869338 RepID=UPI003F7F57FF
MAVRAVADGVAMSPRRVGKIDDGGRGGAGSVRSVLRHLPGAVLAGAAATAPPPNTNPAASSRQVNARRQRARRETDGVAMGALS